MDPDEYYWRGFHDCRADLRRMLDKNPSWSAESQMIIVRAYLAEDLDDLFGEKIEIHDRPKRLVSGDDVRPSGLRVEKPPV